MPDFCFCLHARCACFQQLHGLKERQNKSKRSLFLLFERKKERSGLSACGRSANCVAGQAKGRDLERQPVPRTRRLHLLRCLVRVANSSCLDASRKIAGPPLFPFLRAASRNCSAPRGMRRIGWRERGERWWWWSDAVCPFFKKKFSSFLFCLRLWSQLRVDTGSTEFGAACAQLGHSARSTMAGLCCYACTHGQRTPPPFLQRIQNPR